MLHHLSFATADLARSGAFYDAVLGALGYRRVFEAATAVGYGLVTDEDQFCLKLRHPVTPPGPGFHLAFAAPSRAAVDAFHAAALAQGGQDNGAPGLRPDYGPTYYAAFVIDPDGHRIEAVFKG
ncbi:catechol 2,3-dioxygenase-like lactoylglutathione lyase family enzyme [Inhella inkyongensis]|uniref:Catechol 2,3-dioxygenase-like lactoylglutathione lyase family enzyme n=1 Tax=Inhella inkyongensis TaxID=392593 RepID=A0A840S4T7_9BURK|nr:VOC family protein [Inhella inkyongensis]MBB5204046.1 catechol 2,3-dioxygenase-like lactoylglutathione lyase family enzyme [Inhella inkyongensis]